MSEKYGFVYIWRDVKRKMFYIGCHWGREDDGYICSSNRMRDAFRRRPEDFKRRILSRVYTNRVDLLKEEYRWLLLIPPHELGTVYYNLRQHQWGHWTSDEDKKKTIGEKISLKNKGKPRPRTEEHQRKLNESLRGKPRSPETIEKMRMALSGRKCSPESIKKREDTLNERGSRHKFEKGCLSWNKGRTTPQDVRDKIGKSSLGRMSGRVHWNDGMNNKCCHDCPGEGWVRGLITKRWKKDDA